MAEAPWIRGLLAMLAGVAAFIVPVGIIALPVFQLSTFQDSYEVLKAWLAFIGPISGAVIGHYFNKF